MNDNLLKLVQYYIVWTQPDVEVALDEDRILINYPTTSEELAGLILLNWVSAPPTEDRPNGNIALIPSQLVADRRYLKVRLHVIERFAVEDKYYDRRQTQAQEEIAETLERGFGG